MGCVSSKPDINEQHPNIFQVANVNEQGELISPGQLEVTETELVLHQKGKPPTVWPLRSLRKYGFDSEIFSFECGRRCPTGQGIYAFKTRKAEQLFNVVQQNISRNIDDNIGDAPVPAVSTGPPVQRRNPSQTEGYLNPVSVPTSVRAHPVLTRPGSVSSNGPISPTLLSPPPTEGALEHNNNSRAPEHSYTNTSALVDGDPQPNYANLGLGPASCSENYVNVPGETPCHLYMNIDTKDAPYANTKEGNELKHPLPEIEEETTHCYANIDAKEIEQLRPLMPNDYQAVFSEVNYAKLDFDPDGVATQSIPDSPNKVQKSYATIDFRKTNALSQSINPRLDMEEGSRKTRHNSTISDVTTGHSSSISD